MLIELCCVLYQRPPSRRSSNSSDNLTSAAGLKPRRNGHKTSHGRERTSQKVRRGKRTTKTRKSPSRSESDSDANMSCHSEGSRVSFDPAPSDTEASNPGLISFLFGSSKSFRAAVVFVVLFIVSCSLDFTSYFIFFLLLIIYIHCYFHNSLDGTKWPFMLCYVML